MENKEKKITRDGDRSVKSQRAVDHLFGKEKLGLCLYRSVDQLELRSVRIHEPSLPSEHGAPTHRVLMIPAGLGHRP